MSNFRIDLSCPTLVFDKTSNYGNRENSASDDIGGVCKLLQSYGLLDFFNKQFVETIYFDPESVVIFRGTDLFILEEEAESK